MTLRNIKFLLVLNFLSSGYLVIFKEAILINIIRQSLEIMHSPLIDVLQILL